MCSTTQQRTTKEESHNICTTVLSAQQKKIGVYFSECVFFSAKKRGVGKSKVTILALSLSLEVRGKGGRGGDWVMLKTYGSILLLIIIISFFFEKYWGNFL